MTEEELDKAITPNVAGARSFVIPEWHKKSTIVCEITSKKDTPVDALAFAMLIRAQVKILKALERETGGKAKTEWCITEAAVIGDRASFALTGYPKETIAAVSKASEQSVVK